MQEIKVVSNLTPGVISWNFEDIKNQLSKIVSDYDNLVYTDDKVKEAKSDIAELRKLRKAVEDKRKEIKNECLKPYEVIEEQAKELVALIDKPISSIDTQIKEYEVEQKKIRKERITAFYVEVITEHMEDCPEMDACKNDLYKRIYEDRWCNASAKVSEWQGVIRTSAEKVHEEIQTIKNMNSEFEKELIECYFKAYSLAEAISKNTELVALKEAMLQKEREKIEAEVKEEIKEEVKAEVIQEVQNETPVEPVVTKTEFIEPVIEEIPKVADENERTLTIIASEEQFEKIKNYIRFVGANIKED